MKKFLTLVLAIAMAAMAVSAFAVEADLVFGAQETGTGGYTYATAIQTAINKSDPEIQISLATITSGNVSSPVLIENGDAETSSSPTPLLRSGLARPALSLRTFLPARASAASPAAWAMTL